MILLCTHLNHLADIFCEGVWFREFCQLRVVDFGGLCAGALALLVDEIEERYAFLGLEFD